MHLKTTIPLNVFFKGTMTWLLGLGETGDIVMTTYVIQIHCGETEKTLLGKTPLMMMFL